MYPDFQKCFVLKKVEEGPSGLATCWGIATSEALDSDGEIASYPETARSYKAWSQKSLDETTSAGQQPSLGNVRLMHAAKIAGKVTKLECRDADKQIWVGVEAADKEISAYLRRGLVKGFSHAGKYGRRWHKECGTDLPSGNHCPTCGTDVPVSYYPDPVTELSLVDAGSNPEATFEYVKASGACEVRKFLKEGTDFMSKAMSPKQLVERTIDHHKEMAGRIKKIAETERQLGKCAEARADFATAALHKIRGDVYDEMAAAHSQHIERLGAARSSMPDTWALGGETVDANGNTVDGKAAGVDGDDFFAKVFGAWPSPAMPAPQPSGDLFK